MTTDPFTDAARAEAEDYARTPRMNVGTVRDRIAEAHQAGAEWARTHLAAQEPTDAELDALYDAFMAHSEDERSEEYTRTEDGEPYHERICSECGEAVWIKGEHYWAATRANGARKRHHVARAALSAARAARRDEERRDG